MGDGDTSIVDEATSKVKLLRDGLANPQGFTLFLRGEGAQSAQQWKRVRLSRSLSDTLSSDVIGCLGRFLDRDLAEYTYDDLTPSVLGVWRTGDIPELSSWFQEVPDHTWGHIFDGAVDFVETIRFEVFLIQTTHGPVRVFLKKGASAIVHKGRAAWFSTAKNEFSEVDGQVFTFEAGVDFFEFQGHVFVGHSMAFELVTNVRKITSERAGAVINTFDGKSGGDVVLLQRKELIGAINRKPLFAKKLASARMMGTISALTGIKMVNRIKSKGLNITYEIVNGKYHFKIDEKDKKSLREFIDLITDTYLVSDVTDLEYKTHAKERA